MPYLKIIRPMNCLFVILTVSFGAYYKADLQFALPVLFAVFATFFIAAAGYVINDFFDYEIDIINRSDRILPTGLISLKAAKNYAFLLFATGIIFSVLTQNEYCIILAIINSILLYLYSKYFKKMFFLGNLVVAYNSASTFVFGGLSNQNVKHSIIISLLAFLYTIVREIVKDVEDMDGDSKQGAKTIAVLWGNHKSLIFAALPAITIITLIQVFGFNQSISWYSYLFLNLLVTLPLAIFFAIMFKNKKKSTLNRISGLMKLDMLILLVIMMIGR